MKKFLLIFLITANSYAGYWCPENPSQISFPKPHEGCFEVGQDFDTETADVVNGMLIISTAKIADKNARVSTENALMAAKARKIADCETLYGTVDSVTSIPQVKAILKCLVRDAR